MASAAMSASISMNLVFCNSQHIIKKQSTQTLSSGTKQSIGVVNVEGLKLADKKQEIIPTSDNNPMDIRDDDQIEKSGPRFSDERWRNGTWDLNMFVKNGRMDWDSIIVAEAKRRKFLEIYPDVSSNEDPVLFRSSIIPWWAWILHFHLPEAELINGRAAMVGFFMAYIVDFLTGLSIVGQTGKFLCKTALLLTIIGVVVFRRREDIDNLQKLADETTFYDKQWQASWQNQDSNEQTNKNI